MRRARFRASSVVPRAPKYARLKAWCMLCGLKKMLSLVSCCAAFFMLSSAKLKRASVNEIFDAGFWVDGMSFPVRHCAEISPIVSSNGIAWKVEKTIWEEKNILSFAPRLWGINLLFDYCSLLIFAMDTKIWMQKIEQVPCERNTRSDIISSNIWSREKTFSRDASEKASTMSESYAEYDRWI